jgi:xanthine dehydrogenase YagT iron-sulfur-binding subunit
MTTSEHEAAAASAATPTGTDDSDTNGLSRRDVLQLAGSIVFLVGMPTGTTRAATSTEEEALAMATVRLTVNGQTRQLEIDPRQSLLDLLRETLDLTGTKKGCNQGACGACTVLLNGKRIVSCLTLAAMQDGARIETIEGLTSGDELHPLQAAFIEHEGLQCGFCTPGQIMSGLGCIAEGHARSPEEIQFWMSGNICRCGAYPGIVAAIADAARRT